MATPFFVRDVPFYSDVDLRLGERFGGTAVSLHAQGVLSLGFQPTERPDFYNVAVNGIDIEYRPFSVALTGERHIDIDGIRLTSCAFDLPACTGGYNVETGEITVRFVVTLSQKDYPAVAEALGINAPIRAVVTERGRFDISTGEMEIHAAQFVLNHSPDLVQWRGGKKDCGVNVGLAAAISEPYLGDRRGAGEVMICPGKTAELGWTIDHPNALGHQGQLVAGTGQPTGVGIPAADRGHATVRPDKTTEYWVSVDTADCNDVRSNSVVVTVVQTGLKLTMTANYKETANGAHWEFVAPQALYDPDIFVTSIEPTTCLTGGVWPTWWFNKTELDGHLRGGPCNEGGSVVDPEVQLAAVGPWILTPLNAEIWLRQNYADACFELTLTCR